MNADKMLHDAVAAGIKSSMRNIRQKITDAVLLQPTYESPFGHHPQVDAKIDEIMALLLPVVREIEHNKVYARMAKVLREGVHEQL